MRILGILGVIMFFRKDPPQTEGRRNADLLIKTPPEDPAADATVYGLFGRSAIYGRSTGPDHQFTHHTDQARAMGPRESFARGHQVP